jgi:hypothetical protein
MVSVQAASEALGSRSQWRSAYIIDLSPRTIWRSKVLGPSIKAKPVPAPQSLESVPGAHAIEYVVAVASPPTIEATSGCGSNPGMKSVVTESAATTELKRAIATVVERILMIYKN